MLLVCFVFPDRLFFVCDFVVLACLHRGPRLWCGVGFVATVCHILHHIAAHCNTWSWYGFGFFLIRLLDCPEKDLFLSYVYMFTCKNVCTTTWVDFPWKGYVMYTKKYLHFIYVICIHVNRSTYMYDYLIWFALGRIFISYIYISGCFYVKCIYMYVLNVHICVCICIWISIRTTK